MPGRGAGWYLPRMVALDAAGLVGFLEEHFPRALSLGFVIAHVDEQRIRLELPTDRAGALRPGGTVSGPTMMTLADTAMFLLVLAQIGPVPGAVTSSLNIQFLRRPQPGTLTAEGELLRLGKRLAVGDVRLHDGSAEGPVAQATVTYSIPDPERAGAR